MRHAPRGLAVDLDVPPGEVLAVLGPNGAGKSTLLDLLAGLLRPTAGRIALDGRVLTAAGATGREVLVPAHRRGVALLAQDPLLLPHLSAADNVAFGPRSTGASRREARERAARWLDAVGAGHLAARRPRRLSGGQAQRVAIARALATRPRLLLLDEPMAALDVTAAPEVRRVLREVLRGGQHPERPGGVVLVTHDLLDVLALADRVAVLQDGRVAERGDVHEVLTRPRSAFAAGIAGLVLLTGRATADGLRTADGTLVAGLVDDGCPPGGPAVAVLDPAAVAVHAADPGGSPRNRWRVTVTQLEPRGRAVRVRGRHGPLELFADVTVEAAAEARLAPGDEVHFVVKATAVRVHAAGG
ncbi:ABC transporter ATP-binding protein [Kineococcus sp. TRM81007]|uniref:sulfate/molybdate ABC transporter ATP-binding protein n=1 Tax=Kineococcus sp. TRM81007 TaxID=2925831 RepID=UPI001F5642FA|nr:ABC transporter ATP-binding protein [Kineococcus sp. TRM81007]MCI2240493.1 ABC transporter ATP-binding protein [Kineococcus sp. TRM81007]